MKNYYSFLPPIAQEKLTQHAKNSIENSFLLTKKNSARQVNNLCLFYGIFLEKGSMGSNIIQDMGFKKKNFEDYFSKNIVSNLKNEKSDFPIEFSQNSKDVVLKAYSISKNLGYGYVGTEHLTYSLLEFHDNEIDKMIALLKKQSINLEKHPPVQKDSSQFLKNLPELEQNFSSKKISDSNDFFSTGIEIEKDNFLNLFYSNKKSRKNSPYPFVEKFCENINQRVIEKKEILIGREEELERIIQILGRKNKNNPLLIGNPGVGKTALVMGLARKINQNKVPEFLLDKKIMSLDITSLIAGTNFRGEFESRLKKIIQEIEKNKKIILFIDEIHNIVGAGNVQGNMDLANIIKPALAQGEIRLIGATTFPEFKKNIEKDAALERRFQTVILREPGKEETKKILFGIKKSYENFHNVSIDKKALDLTVEMAERYIKNRFLPDKAIDIIDETAARIRSEKIFSSTDINLRQLKNEKQRIILEKEILVKKENFEKAIQLKNQEEEKNKEIEFWQKKQKLENDKKPTQIVPDDIFKTISQISGIPKEKISQSENEKIKNLLPTLEKKIIGQKDILEKIVFSLLRFQSGIENTDRPIGSFLFLGPTGTGKTFTAKILAQDFFSKKESFIRIDMSELMEKHSLSSLIGSPAGYIGYGEGGKLTEKVRRNPYCVVLFDEIEKAHPDVLNILLQILEDGILTDAEGLEVNFKNTLIILTTNIGTEYFTNLSKIGFQQKNSAALNKNFETIKQKTLSELKNKLKTELLNRLDNILVFHPLTQKDILKITAIEIEKFKKKLKKQNLDLIISPPALKFFAKISFSQDQGARLVAKNICEKLKNPIAEMIIKKKIKKNKITAQVQKNHLKIF